MKFVKSPLNYVGGKYKLLPQIIPLFPNDIETFYDLFAGGCNVGVNVKANRILCNDIIKPLISLMNYFKENDYEYIVDEINSIIDKYGLSKTSIYGYEYYNTNSNKGVYNYNKEKFEKLKNDYNNGFNSDIVFYTLIVFSFNNSIRFNDKGEYNQSCNKRDFNKKLQTNLKHFIERLKEINIQFTSRDFREFNVKQFNKYDFVYCDPPYLITNANYNERNGWTENDEVDLLNFLDGLDKNGVRFALSNVFRNRGKQNYILIEWAKKYNVHKLNYTYGNCNYHAKDKSMNNTEEVLITNY